ncbi:MULTISPECIES: chaperonin GroEL [unclassified Adlercreutzia]|uniref:chaperonin GroEL n=1 Tax=unclassified Adlercreutzia TaxID=2636013 RepID=UPI0013ED84BA|nr:MULTISPECIES: chaperonin GroEL [unclassified Adlercreutzia]
MSKNIEYAGEARADLAAGVSKLAAVVRLTLGPKGRYVCLQGQRFGEGMPIITNDGVTVAKEIDLPDPTQQMGAMLVREAAIKTNEIAGDGTTTATILADVLVREGLKNIVAGSEPLGIRRGMQKACDAVVEAVRNAATPVTGKEQIANIGTISAGDVEIGNIIAEAMDAVGQDGAILVEDGKTFEMEMEIIEGMQYERSYLSPAMANDGDVCLLEDPYILLTDYTITNVQDILPLLEEVAKTGRPLFIVCEQLKGEALATLLMNNERGTLKMGAIRAPGWGDRRESILEDIAVVTGADVVSKHNGLFLSDARLSMLGSARTVKIDRKFTLIVGGQGDPAAIEKRIAEARADFGRAEDDFDREKYKERLAKLASGVAVLKVGAVTESEATEKKSRIEDALQATRAAVEEGIVSGGGVALAEAALCLDELEVADDTERIGVDIVRAAMEEPLRAIAENSGFKPDVVVDRVQGLPTGEGLNCANGEYGNMIDMGVIDPVKVTRVALQSALSVASLILIGEASINELKEDAAQKKAEAAKEFSKGTGMGLEGMF